MSRVTEAHVEARRKAILDAATHIFATEGIANATMAEIAAGAGLSAGAIYRYFAGKQELVEACFRHDARKLAEEWAFQFGSTTDPRATLFEIAARSFEEINEEGAASRTRMLLERYLEAGRGDGDMTDCTAERRALIEGLRLGLDLMKQSGQLPADLDTKALAAVLWAFWVGARVSKLLEPSTNIEGQLAAFQALITAAGAGVRSTAKTAG